MIIGLTGTYASGKSTAAKYLVKKGYKYYSLSDELRKLMSRRKIEHTRGNLIEAGNYYRKKHGRGYLARIVKRKIKGKNAVVDSIRNLGEVEELRRMKNFVLIAVDAPVKTRFERAKKRMSRRDHKTLKEFAEHERRELHGRGFGQQLAAVMRKADAKIWHTGNSYSKFYKKIETTLERYDSER
ncbi:AAA family ATPase [Candidatus Woesearchaeota archaeon]|nr:AAA family ATPase [Candidatus Woesearchaeota archaeon]